MNKKFKLIQLKRKCKEILQLDMKHSKLLIIILEKWLKLNYI